MIPPSYPLASEGRRKVPMEVLVLGLCRTGTMSMKIGLEELGYGDVYHMSTIFDHESHARLWVEALETKFGPSGADSKKRGEMMSAEYWDRILGGYGATTDIPSACFVPELLSAYPTAKLILTTRSSATWLRSMTRTIHALQTSRLDRFLLQLRSADLHLLSVSRVMDLVIEYCFAGDVLMFGEEGFRRRNEEVRDLVREEGKGRELLEFEVGRDGWEVLCGFLGRDVPGNGEMGFPHVNDSESFRAAFRLDLGRRILIFSVVLVGVFVVLGSWGLYF